MQLDVTVHLVVREALTRMAILDCESNWLATVRPNNNGEVVRYKVVISPFSLDIHGQCFASFHIKRISVESSMFKAFPAFHLTVSDPERGFPWVFIAVAIIKVLTVVLIRTDIDILIHGVCKRNLLREWLIWSIEVKEGFVFDLLSLHIWIGWCEPKLLMEVSSIHEPNAVISCEMASLLFELFCPLHTIVTPVAMIGLWTPRVPYLIELCVIAEPNSAEDSVGMGVWETVVVLNLVATRAYVATSSNHPVFGQLAVDVVPEFINAYFSVLCVEKGWASHHLNGRSHPTTDHHFVISVEFCDGLFENW